MTPTELVAKWRADAARARDYGDERGATILGRLAGELETAMKEQASETLTLAEAAAESGYSERRIRQLIAEGAIPQAGRKGVPRVRRSDLPHRPRKSTRGYDPRGDAAALVARLSR